jgi:serine/threonine-protein kinase
VTPECWQQVRAVFETALDCAEEERAAFLERACGADRALRQEVDSLLAAERDADGFLEPAPAGQALAERLRAAFGGQYAIEHELGGGGMSRVFVATETALGRRVVVKVLPPGVTGEVSVERFRREVRMAAGLRHPLIVPVLAAGEADGLVYYTMPYVEGESLKERLARDGTLPIDDAVTILAEVAEALSSAHQHGIAHRDIRPANILLDACHANLGTAGGTAGTNCVSRPSTRTRHRTRID